MSVAAITTSFLGAQALGTGGSGFLIWLAMTAFIGTTAMSLAILWPKRWEFTADPQSVLRTYSEAEEPTTLDELQRDLALYMHNSLVENKRGLERLAVLFQIDSVLLTIEVAFWIVAIASH